MKLSLLPALSLFLAVPVFGQDSPAGEKTGGEPKLKSRFYQQQTAVAGEITRGVLTAQHTQFSFVLPAGFRHDVSSAGKKFSLISTSFTCSATAEIHEAAIEGKADLKPETVRQQILGRHNGTRIVDEFNANLESMTGPAFEAEWKSEAGTLMATRTAFVPYSAGHIEFNFQAPASEIRLYDGAFNQFLTSFRSSPVGAELVVQEFSDEL